MKNVEKVICFIILYVVATVLLKPTTANADVTINVVKPSDWNGVVVQAWNEELGDITTWPGVRLVKNGDKYSYTIKVEPTQKIILRLNDDGEGRQTTQIDGLDANKGDGKGISQGCYDITIGEKIDKSINEYTWTMVESIEVDTLEKVRMDKTVNVKTPTTGDSFEIVLLGCMCIILSISVYSLYKRRITY